MLVLEVSNKFLQRDPLVIVRVNLVQKAVELREITPLEHLYQLLSLDIAIPVVIQVLERFEEGLFCEESGVVREHCDKLAVVDLTVVLILHLLQDVTKFRGL